jgi:hypothetical protein
MNLFPFNSMSCRIWNSRIRYLYIPWYEDSIMHDLKATVYLTKRRVFPGGF